MAAISGESEAGICSRFAGRGFGDFKPALADTLIALLSPLRSRLVELRRDESAIDAFLEAGASRAATLAEPTLVEAYRAVGLRG
jgi:tryptophanyl-tRNA synthetase